MPQHKDNVHINTLLLFLFQWQKFQFFFSLYQIETFTDISFFCFPLTHLAWTEIPLWQPILFFHKLFTANVMENYLFCCKRSASYSCLCNRNALQLYMENIRKLNEKCFSKTAMRRNEYIKQNSAEDKN